MNYVRKQELEDIIRTALREDTGERDITTLSVVPEGKYAKTSLLAKEPCVICGLDIVKMVFKLKDRNIKFKPYAKDGQKISKGKVVARVSGEGNKHIDRGEGSSEFLEPAFRCCYQDQRILRQGKTV